MIVFDEWPQNSIFDATGEIDADLYPNLAALAADGAWYRNATTVATATVAAVPALLTGRYAVDGASPTAADHPENLFTLLASQYDLEVSEVRDLALSVEPVLRTVRRRPRCLRRRPRRPPTPRRHVPPRPLWATWSTTPWTATRR